MTSATNEELDRIQELLRQVTEQNKRRASNAAALEAARRQIEELGQFVPKADQPPPIVICF